MTLFRTSFKKRKFLLFLLHLLSFLIGKISRDDKSGATTNRSVVSLSFFWNDVEVHLTFEDAKTWMRLNQRNDWKHVGWGGGRWNIPGKWKQKEEAAFDAPVSRSSALLDTLHAGKRTIPALYFHHWLHPRCIAVPPYIHATVEVESVSNEANGAWN